MFTFVKKIDMKGDNHEGSEKTRKNVNTRINFTFAIPCNEIIAFLVIT